MHEESVISKLEELINYLNNKYEIGRSNAFIYRYFTEKYNLIFFSKYSVIR